MSWADQVELSEQAELSEQSELGEQSEISWAEKAKKTNSSVNSIDLNSTKSLDLITPKEVEIEKRKNVLKIAEIESKIKENKEIIQEFKNEKQHMEGMNMNKVTISIQNHLCSEIIKNERLLAENEKTLELLYRNKVTLDDIQFTGLEICKRSIRGNHNFYPNLLKYIVESIQAEVGEGVEVGIQDVLDYFNFIHEYDKCETQRALLDHIMRRFLNVILGHYYGTNGDGPVIPKYRLGKLNKQSFGQQAFGQQAFGQQAFGQQAFGQKPRGNLTYGDQLTKEKHTRAKSARKGRKY
jgi:hypothetical protein